MKKEIHFYKYYPINSKEYGFIVYHSWKTVSDMIKRNENIIHTTQMGLMSMDLIEQGYKIFVHDDLDDMYEIKLGSNDRTEKCLRLAHNIFKMWRAGAFVKK